MDQEPHPPRSRRPVTLSFHSCVLCGAVVPRTVPVWIEEPSGPGTTMRLCLVHAAGVVREDPRRRRQALCALDQLAEAMRAWPALEVVVSAEVDRQQVLLRVETDHGGSCAPLTQVVTVAPGDDGVLWFWFLWLADRFSQAHGPVLHPIGAINDLKNATTKLGVMLALL